MIDIKTIKREHAIYIRDSWLLGVALRLRLAVWIVRGSKTQKPSGQNDPGVLLVRRPAVSAQTYRW